MKDVERLRDLVLDGVDLATLMLSYGVDFVYDPQGMNEVQYKCPFHGIDTKPSARFYRDTKSTWCWVCRKKRDVISFTMEKESMSYVAAILHLVSLYNLDTSSIPDTPRLDLTESKTIDGEEVFLMSTKTNILDMQGKAPFESYRALVAAWYMISYAKAIGKGVMEQLHRLESKVREAGSRCP